MFSTDLLSLYPRIRVNDSHKNLVFPLCFERTEIFHVFESNSVLGIIENRILLRCKFFIVQISRILVRITDMFICVRKFRKKDFKYIYFLNGNKNRSIVYPLHAIMYFKRSSYMYSEFVEIYFVSHFRILRISLTRRNQIWEIILLRLLFFLSFTAQRAVFQNL